MRQATSDRRQGGRAPHRAAGPAPCRGLWCGAGSGAGFTIYELLVIVGIMTVLTGIAFSYTRRSEGQIALFRDRAAVSSLILRARSLAIQTFRPDPMAGSICGYGVRLTAAGAATYRVRPAGGTCSETPNFSAANAEEVDAYALDPRAALDLCATSGATPANPAAAGSGASCVPLGSQANATLDILFLPPDPRVRFAPFDPSYVEYVITVRARDGSSSIGEIVVNRAGQVTVGL